MNVGQAARDCQCFLHPAVLTDGRDNGRELGMNTGCSCDCRGELAVGDTFVAGHHAQKNVQWKDPAGQTSRVGKIASLLRRRTILTISTRSSFHISDYRSDADFAKTRSRREALPALLTEEYPADVELLRLRIASIADCGLRIARKAQAHGLQTVGLGDRQ